MAKKQLQAYFPLIRTREEVLGEIREKKELFLRFHSWEEEQQEEFLDFCTGIRGVKITYDAFFKEIMSPEVHPERLERMISVILGRKVKIQQILPNDSVRIADEETLLITDIVVELEDGSIANVEIQKIGYAFPGQRCACYSADLLLRQYKRVKGKEKKKFTYRSIKTVYTIVLLEKSTEEFAAISGQFVHRSKQVFNTGLKLQMLQEFILIPLDIFKESKQNKSIENELEAWLTFFTTDEPERIVKLLEGYPDFREIYEEIYDICLNTERVMEMFSKELLELDRNTVRYMIEEQQERLDEQQERLAEQERELAEQERELAEQTKLREEQEKELAEQAKLLAEKEKELADLKLQLVAK